MFHRLVGYSSNFEDCNGPLSLWINNRCCAVNKILSKDATWLSSNDKLALGIVAAVVPLISLVQFCVSANLLDMQAYVD